jgi:hypothetical protein
MDRIVIDAGGTKFPTVALTLTSNSAYFASLLSGEWKESADGEDEIFLDRDPVAFGKLLDYMRQGMIRVEDIDANVLILAEFLGIDKLLLAVKVRWYCNIGKGPVAAESDEAIAASFDEVHGGISKALSKGLFPFFLEQDDVNAEKDLAVMTVHTDDIQVVVREIKNGNLGPTIGCGDVFGALNGLHRNGYTSFGDPIERDLSFNQRESISFYRRRHSTMRIGDATSIFIPPHDENEKRRANAAKQFAVYIMNEADHTAWIIAPAEFIRGADQEVDEDNDISHPYSVATIENEDFYFWLERHNFTIPEIGYLLLGNKMFQKYINYLSRGLRVKCEIQIYSRLSSVQNEE